MKINLANKEVLLPAIILLVVGGLLFLAFSGLSATPLPQASATASPTLAPLSTTSPFPLSDIALRESDLPAAFDSVNKTELTGPTNLAVFLSFRGIPAEKASGIGLIDAYSREFRKNFPTYEEYKNSKEFLAISSTIFVFNSTEGASRMEFFDNTTTGNVTDDYLVFSVEKFPVDNIADATIGARTIAFSKPDGQPFIVAQIAVRKANYFFYVEVAAHHRGGGLLEQAALEFAKTMANRIP